MILEAKNINKYYSVGKNRLHVLKDVSLGIKGSETVAIVGPSGAGKSTLLHILGGLDNPTGGEVMLDGRSLRGLAESGLSVIRNSIVGFVFQFYHLLPEFNVLENVMMPVLIKGGKERSQRLRSQRQEALGLLEELGLTARSGHLPAQLSGGEQQRVAIARALINEPRLLLCDEPTGNLDSENGRQICQLLLRVNREKGMAIVIVTHNLDVAKLMSKVYNIIDGRLQFSNHN